HVVISEDVPPGADAAMGGNLFRETVVEYDAPARRMRFHDPERWVRAEGYYRCILDDDGDLPIAILQKRGRRARATAGATAPKALTLRAEAADRLAFPPGSRTADGLHWGPAPLPPLELETLSGEAAA